MPQASDPYHVCSLSLSKSQCQICKDSISKNDPNHNADPCLLQPGMNIESFQYRSAANLSNRVQITLVHAMVVPSGRRRARVCPSFKLVDHHSLEDVRLVINVVENILPERIEDVHRHQKAVDAHPEAVKKSGHGERYDKNREYGGYQYDERLCCHEIEKKPHHPH